MPQTYTQLHYHLVFSTKHRRATITPGIRDRLWRYLGGIVSGEGGIPWQIGGMPDHIHALSTLRPTHDISTFLRKLKASSSGWAHDDLGATDLWWQTGYSAFTVSHSGLDAVTDYIRRQEERHRTMTFQEELRQLLENHGIQYDERYLWD